MNNISRARDNLRVVNALTGVLTGRAEEVVAFDPYRDGRMTRESGVEEVAVGRGRTCKENVQYRVSGISDREPAGSRELVPDRADMPKRVIFESLFRIM